MDLLRVEVIHTDITELVLKNGAAQKYVRVTEFFQMEVTFKTIKSKN